MGVKLLATKETLHGEDKEALFHALDIAQRTLQEDLELWNKVKPSEMVTPNGIAGMKLQFQFYVDRMNALREKLDDADDLVLITGEDGDL